MHKQLTIIALQGFLSAVRLNPLLGVGMIDFAGSGVVHVTGGFTALIASKILGPRKGRFDEEKGVGMARRIEGNSSALQALGCLLLWFGWCKLLTKASSMLCSICVLFSPLLYLRWSALST